MPVTVAELRISFTGELSSFEKANVQVQSGVKATTALASASASTFERVAASLVLNAKAAGLASGSVDTLAASLGVASKESTSLNRTLSSTAITNYAGRVETSGKAVVGLGNKADATRAKIAALNAEYDRMRPGRTPSIGGGASGGNVGSGASSGIGKFASSTSQIGRTLTTDVTMPLLAIDAAAIKVETDYEAAMGKVRALGGVSKEQADSWSAAILKMGPAIGQSPKALADALLYVSSEGYRGAEALSVLDRAGRMSSVGMGSVATNARAVVFAMHDFAYQHLTATQASDALTAATRTGNFQIDQLSGSLSRVLPIAANLGITFPQTVAAIAGITKAGAPASQAVTDLARILMTFEHPTRQTSTALKKLGLDVGEVTEHMRKDFLGALVEIESASRGNEAQFTKVFGSVKAFGGVLALTGGNLREARAGFDSVVHSAGTLGAAFDAGAGQASRSLARFKAQMEADGVAIGAALVPSLKAAEGDVMAVGRAFTDLSPATQRTIVDFGLVAAAAGPLVSGVGGVARTIKSLADLRGVFTGAAAAESTALGGLATAEGTAAVAAGALDVALLPLIATIGAVALAGYGLFKAYQYVTSGTERARQETLDALRVNQQATAAYASYTSGMARHAGQTANLYREYEILRDRTNRTAEESHRFNVIMGQIGDQNPGLITAFDSQGHAVGLLSGQYANLAAEADRAGAAARRAANEARVASVTAIHQVPVMDAMGKVDQARQTQYEAQVRLAELRTRGSRRVLSGRMDANGDFPNQETVFDKSSESYREELERASVGLQKANAARAAAESAQASAQAAERKAFNESHKTPAQRAAEAAASYGQTPAQQPHTMLGGGGGGDDGKPKRAKEDEATKDANRIHQALLDTLQREGTAYLLLGKSSDVAATRLELQTGQYAKQGKQLGQLNYLVSQMDKAGALDPAARSLGYKGFDGLQGDARLKVELLALTTLTEARQRDIKAQEDARKAEGQNASDAIKQIQDARKAANDARIALEKQIDPRPKNVAALDQFRVSYRDLRDPKAIQAVDAVAASTTALEGLKAYDEAWKKIVETVTEAGQKQREAIAAGTSGREQLLRDLNARNATLRARTPEDSTAAHVASYIGDNRDKLFGPGQSSLGMAANVAAVASLIAQNDALEKSRTYANDYDQAMRGVRREILALTSATDAARIAQVEFSESGTRVMEHWQAANLVAMQKVLAADRAYREQAHQYGDMLGSAVSEGLHAGLEKGLKGGVKALLMSLNKQIEDASIAGISKSAGAWLTRSMNAHDPNRQPQNPNHGPGFWGDVGLAAKGAMGKGGQNAALPANTTALGTNTAALARLAAQMAVVGATGPAKAGAGGLASLFGLGGVAGGDASLYAGGGSASYLPGGGSGGFNPWDAGSDAAMAAPSYVPHFANGGRLRAGQAAIVNDGQGGGRSEMVIPDAGVDVLPADLTGRIMGAIKGCGSGGSTTTTNNGGDTHNHFNIAPQIHVSGKMDRRSETQIHGAVGDAVRKAMHELR